MVTISMTCVLLKTTSFNKNYIIVSKFKVRTPFINITFSNRHKRSMPLSAMHCILALNSLKLSRHSCMYFIGTNYYKTLIHRNFIANIRWLTLQQCAFLFYRE